MRCMVLLCVLCWGSSALAARAAGLHGGPRFMFKKGATLTYEVRSSVKGTSAMGGEKTGYASTLEGELVLTVQGVRADGTADVKLAATGKGKMTAGHETMPLDQEPASALIALVKPNGAIVELMDERGEKTSLLQGMENLGAASTQIQTLLIGDYTLFGLQLPEKLPAPGRSYTGTHKEEHGRGSDFEHMKIELRSIPATFVYKGPGRYEGRDCLVFTCDMKASGPQDTGISIPTTFYFDDKEGRLLAVEQHAKNLSTEKMTIDQTVRLVVPKAGA